MSVNWVMKSSNDEGFIKLPNERVLYKSPPRTSLQISTPNKFPGAQPFTSNSDSGTAYITNQRIVYLPSSPTPELQSFSSPILNLEDTFVRVPFFGANYWTALCKPVSGGGIPPTHPSVELRMTFREGGAYDFQNTFEQIKERLHQAYMVARENGHRATNVSLADVDLEQLPAYEPAEEIEANGETNPVPAAAGDSAVAGVRSPAESLPGAVGSSAPAEPPPGYEETQAYAVGVSLEQRLREEAERQRDYAS